MEDLKSGLDKPKFEAQGSNLGAVDIKIDFSANRLAVSSIDYSLSIYNVHPESGLTHYKDTQKFDHFDVNKIDFNPNGNEIISGIQSLKVYDIGAGTVTKEFNKKVSAISSVAYVLIFHQ